MIFGPFACLPAQLVIHKQASIEEWETHAKKIFDMQKYVPWWIGDLANFGEARFGDDFWQIIPEGTQLSLVEKFAYIGRCYPAEQRNTAVTWSHHLSANRFGVETRRAALNKAAEGLMDIEQFSDYVRKIQC